MNPLAESLYYTWKSWEQTDNVRGNEGKRNQLVKLISREMPITPDWRIRGVLPENDKIWAGHAFWHCTVNFATTLFEPPYDKYEIDGVRGSRGIGRAFYRRFGEKPIQAEEILEITESLEKTTEFFQGKNLPPLLEERRRNLREVAEVLLRQFNGDPFRLLENARFLVGSHWHRGYPGMLTLMEKYFPNTFGQDGKFQKRARLFLLMYQGRALHSKGRLPELRDSAGIGPVVDGRVINTFRHHGVIEFSETLKRKIDNRELIDENSHEIFEMRTATNYEFIEIHRALPNWNQMQLDNRFWSFQCSCCPTILCKTTAY